MKPILHSKTYIGTDATYLGVLSDATRCLVTEERNGGFELEMEYHPSGALSGSIEAGAVILAETSYKSNASSAPQPFRIYRVEKNLTGTTVINAHHISYDLNKVVLDPFTATGAAATMTGVANNLQTRSSDQITWNFSTDITNTASKYTQAAPASVRNRLGGVEGSVLDVFGGEYEFDGFDVKLLANRGANNGVVIRYGSNLTELKRDENGENEYTHVMLYYYNEDSGALVTSSVLVVTDASAILSEFPQSRTAIIDVSNDYDSPPTRAQLDTAAAAYVAGLSAHPTVGLDISFIDLNSTTEGGLAADINLCDMVQIIDPGRDVDITAKVVKTVWNVLLDRYDEVTVGTRGLNIADTISGLEDAAEGGRITPAVVYEDFSFSITYSAGTVGTRGYQGSDTVTKTGYEPVAVSMVSVGASNSYIPLAFISSSSIYLNAYRASTGAVNNSSVTVRVAYIPKK